VRAATPIGMGYPVGGFTTSVGGPDGVIGGKEDGPDDGGVVGDRRGTVVRFVVCRGEPVGRAEDGATAGVSADAGTFRA
jgi:hypothetical protein